MKVGLRIDVDTLRGTRHGVPALCNCLRRHGVTGSFFFSVGPDNMGRHLLRLVRPRFFLKMLRTRAASLYGWDILFRGTLWPGPVIGRRLWPVIRSAARDGHEIGLHAWDHHEWQARVERMPSEKIYRTIQQGKSLLTRITGREPAASAAPAWKCTDRVLMEKAKFPFVYNSDCRGRGIFYPVVRGKRIRQPQIPTTLPTYDEIIARDGISDVNYNDYLISLISPDNLNVLTIHAEVEGIVCLAMFDRFVETVYDRGDRLVPLGVLLADVAAIPEGVIVPKEIPGREGWVSCQEGV